MREPTEMRFAFGVSVKDFGWRKMYTGRENALVSAGVVNSEWFPGKEGNNKHSVTLVRDDGAVRMVPSGQCRRGDKRICIRRSSKGMFIVSILGTDEQPLKPRYHTDGNLIYLH
jgi:hypothetical protein